MAFKASFFKTVVFIKKKPKIQLGLKIKNNDNITDIRK